MSLFPLIHKLRGVAFRLREAACSLDEAIEELSTLSPTPATPGDFVNSLTQTGRELCDTEKLAMFNLAAARSAAWGHVASQVTHWDDGIRLANLMRSLPKQPALPETQEEAEPAPAAQRSGR